MSTSTMHTTINRTGGADISLGFSGCVFHYNGFRGHYESLGCFNGGMKFWNTIYTHKTIYICSPVLKGGYASFINLPIAHAKASVE